MTLSLGCCLPLSFLGGSPGISVSLCTLSLVSLSISLGVLVSLCVCLSCHCFCVPISLCVSLTLSVYLSLSMSVSPCVSISVSLSPCLSPGAIQSFAGFTDYFTAMAQEGWFPLLCVGLRPHWENHHLQDLQDSYGQEWVSPMTPLFPMPPTQSTPDTQTRCRLQGKGLSHYHLELHTPASDGPSCRWAPPCSDSNASS